jgi:hypothetical protein
MPVPSVASINVYGTLLTVVKKKHTRSYFKVGEYNNQPPIRSVVGACARISTLLAHDFVVAAHKEMLAGRHGKTALLTSNEKALLSLATAHGFNWTGSFCEHGNPDEHCYPETQIELVFMNRCAMCTAWLRCCNIVVAREVAAKLGCETEAYNIQLESAHARFTKREAVVKRKLRVDLLQ